MADTRTERSNDRGGTQRALIGAGLLAAAGAAIFLFAKRSVDLRDDGIDMSDAPDHVWRRGDRPIARWLAAPSPPGNRARRGPTCAH